MVPLFLSTDNGQRLTDFGYMMPELVEGMGLSLRQAQ